MKNAEAIAEKSLSDVKQSRIKKTKPSLPLEQYVGVYSHPMYGDIKIVKKNKKLRLEGHKQFHGNSSHWHHNSFEVKWDQSRLGTTIINFELNVMGKVEGVEIPGKGFHAKIK